MAAGRSDPGTASRFAAGDVIQGKYALQRPIAKGGMGAVWVAQNTLTERRVAIKFMLPELATSPDTIQRFFREAKASARIDHPCIVDVLDLGTLDDGAPFLVMEFLEGRSLEDVIETQPIQPIQAAALMLDVTHALAAAHAAGIVHRDLKPANVFVAKKGEAVVPKILDFGISKITSTGVGDVRMTRTGAVLGSPAYMSPEQARGRSDIDGRADVWAVGVILYEAVSGKLPFSGENYNQVMMAITLDPPTPLQEVAPAVDPEFLAIVDACLQKDRDKRPPTMDSLAAMLDGYVAPRAAYGIPAIDVGEAGEPRRPASGKIGAYAIPRAVSSKPVPASTRADDPAQLTMGAVTVVDKRPARARRTAFVAGAAAAIVLVGGAIGAFVIMRGKGHLPAAASTTSEITAPSAATSTAANAPAAPSPAPSTTASEPPTTGSATPPPTGSASASAPAATATAVVPSASATAKAPKPHPGAGTAPKLKASAEADGPANVGQGPGF